MKENDFINYLDQFNILSPNHSKIYDEYTHSEGKINYELKIDTKIEKHLIETFTSHPKSVVLTGNAGDGKTRLCRIIHDQFSDENLLTWNKEGIVEVTLPQGKLRIVKDLSELTDEIIERELQQLQFYIQSNHHDHVFYLIAANEGKLTKFLSNNKQLTLLRDMVKSRFKDHKNNNNVFSIYNLMDVTSSVYVEKVLQGWNEEKNWEACSECSQKQRCIIYLNHQKTAKEDIQRRLVEQYRLLDFLDTHITMREMLIHISYILTGGYTCKDIHKADVRELLEQSKRIYYQNFYGHDSTHPIISEMRTMKMFRGLDPGDNSISAIDDFIINGDICGDDKLEWLHELMFNEQLDMQFGYFKKSLILYRDHSSGNNDQLIDEWIQKLRRKLYFEVPENYFLERADMLPFKFVQTYQEMFDNKKKQIRVVKDLLNALNRVFTKRLTYNDGNLYAANENLLINETISVKNRGQVQLVQDNSRDDIDYISSKYYLIINNYTTFPINLYMFEYLLRLNSGDLFHILRENVEISIDTFKNELIQNSEPYEYDLYLFKLDKEKGLYVQTSITLPEEDA